MQTSDQNLIKKVKDSIIIHEGLVYISSKGIADIFNKTIISVESEINKNKLPCLKDKSLDIINFGVLSGGYNSKNAVLAKRLVIEIMLKLERMLLEKKIMRKVGLSEMPQSKLEPVLNEILDKLNAISDKINVLSGSVGERGRRRKELTPEEKIYKEMRLKKIREKVEFEARKTAAQIENEKIYKEKDHGLVYNMEHMIGKKLN